MNPITKAHRLSVARAWDNDSQLRSMLQAWVDEKAYTPRLERLAQLVADAEGQHGMRDNNIHDNIVNPAVCHWQIPSGPARCAVCAGAFEVKGADDLFTADNGKDYPLCYACWDVNGADPGSWDEATNTAILRQLPAAPKHPEQP